VKILRAAYVNHLRTDPVIHSTSTKNTHCARWHQTTRRLLIVLADTLVEERIKVSVSAQSRHPVWTPHAAMYKMTENQQAQTGFLSL
jgi:hypothetical protein